MEKTVYFRTFEESDAGLIYQWMNDDELKKQSIGLNRRMNKEEALNWVKSRMPHNSYQYWWAICAIDTKDMIGYMSLTDIHYINRSGNFSGIMIGDSKYRDGFAWIESYLFLHEFAFEQLGLNRVYGESIVSHKETKYANNIMLSTREGILRQAAFKNGQFHDVVINSLLQQDYFRNKQNGEYEFSAIIKRLVKAKKEK